MFRIRANSRDLVFELTRQVVGALGDDVRVEDHTVGFRYFDSRDQLGFLDGTENPTGRAAVRAAIIAAEDGQASLRRRDPSGPTGRPRARVLDRRARRVGDVTPGVQGKVVWAELALGARDRHLARCPAGDRLAVRLA